MFEDSRSLVAVLLRWMALACALGGCIDQPVCVSRPGMSGESLRLSELGLFSLVDGRLAPASDVIPYDVKLSLYADGEHKHRFVVLPPGAQLGGAPDRWIIPEGTLLIKTFTVPVDERDLARGERLLETRILQRTAGGYRAGVYAWNRQQTDAECSGGNLEVPVSWTDSAGLSRAQLFHVAGTSQCATCHADGGGELARDALGWRTRQLDVPGTGSAAGQIEQFHQRGLLDAVPARAGDGLEDSGGPAPLERRARSYLDVNCGQCHSDGGFAASKHLRFDLANQEPATLGLCRSGDSVDGRHQVIVPGHPERSLLIARMRSGNPFVRMPRGPNQTIDPIGVELLSAWIASLDETACRP